MLAISHQPSTAIELNLFNRLQLPLPQQPLPKLSTATATTLAGQRRKTDNDNLGWNGNWKHLAPCTYYYSTTALQCRRTHSVGWQHHQSEATEEKKWNEMKRKEERQGNTSTWTFGWLCRGHHQRKSSRHQALPQSFSVSVCVSAAENSNSNSNSFGGYIFWVMTLIAATG